ncbi:MAG: hypothetical protein RLZ12_649 [Bacillota bacterium]|jgi:predicted MPP superfamily phosphohydrolase
MSAGFIKSLPIIINLVCSFYYFFFNEQQELDLTCISIVDQKLPASFNNTRIVLLSDLHENIFGTHNKDLIELVQMQKPDYIFCTGDFLDNNPQISIELLQKLDAYAPVYFVPGNHECKSQLYAEFAKTLTAHNIYVFKNNCIYVKKGREKIVLAGVEDPKFKKGVATEPRAPKDLSARLIGLGKDVYKLTKNTLGNLFYTDYILYKKKQLLRGEIEQALPREKEHLYTILLSHRPEQLPLYKKYPIDLVCSGHVHGGLIRLPGLGGLVSYNEGFFPRYTEGLYQQDKTKMVVSRGLGSAGKAFRVNNNPEVVVLTLKK